MGKRRSGEGTHYQDSGGMKEVFHQDQINALGMWYVANYGGALLYLFVLHVAWSQ